MMKFLSYATATSVALVALQGCKSESGPDAVYKGVKAASDTITKDGFAAKNVKDTYTNFEKSVKNVKKMDKKPEAEELKKYKITDMNAELVKMNTAFCTLDKTQAAANMKQYTAKIKAVLTWYDVQTYSCDVTPVTPTPIQKALKDRDNMVAQLKKAIADDKANETKYQAQIDILVKFDKDSKVDDINAAVTTAEGQLPTAQQDEIALKKQKTLIPGLIKKLEALTDKKAETTPLIADLNAALKMKVEDLNKVKKAVKAAKTFIDANKPVVVTPQSAFDKDSEDVEIIPADDKADQELRFKNLTEEQQKAEYEAMKGLEKSVKKTKYAELLTAAKKVLQDARKVVVDGVEGIDADHKNALIAEYNNLSLVAMTADDAALKVKVDAATDAATKKAATKQYFEDELAKIEQAKKIKAADDQFKTDLDLKEGANELSADDKLKLQTQWDSDNFDKLARMELINKARNGEAVTIATIDFPVVPETAADFAKTRTTNVIRAYKAIVAEIDAAELKKTQIAKMNEEYPKYVNGLTPDEKTAEADREAEIVDGATDDAATQKKLDKFLLIADAMTKTEAEITTAYKGFLTTFVDAQYATKKALCVAPHALTANESTVLTTADHGLEAKLALDKRCTNYVALKGAADAAAIKGVFTTFIEQFIKDWISSIELDSESERTVEDELFAALSAAQRFGFWNNHNADDDAAVKLLIEPKIQRAVDARWAHQIGVAVAVTQGEGLDFLGRFWAAQDTLEKKCTLYIAFNPLDNATAENKLKTFLTQKVADQMTADKTVFDAAVNALTFAQVEVAEADLPQYKLDTIAAYDDLANNGLKFAAIHRYVNIAAPADKIMALRAMWSTVKFDAILALPVKTDDENGTNGAIDAVVNAGSAVPVADVNAHFAASNDTRKVSITAQLREVAAGQQVVQLHKWDDDANVDVAPFPAPVQAESDVVAEQQTRASQIRVLLIRAVQAIFA